MKHKENITAGEYTFKFLAALNGGYYNPLSSYIHQKSEGILVYSIDEKGKPFFNKVKEDSFISNDIYERIFGSQRFELL